MSTRIQFYITTALSALCLVGCFFLVALGQSNGRLQDQFRQQQYEISSARANQRVGNSMLQELAKLSQQNDRIKDLLTQNGFSISTPSPSPAQ